MLELSVCSQSDTSNGVGEEAEMSRLRSPLDDLQSQNTMLQDELTLLSNVKGELEAELERTKEEFQMEKEELEFKINELQMINSPSIESVVTLKTDQGEIKHPVVTSANDPNTLNLEEQTKLNEELTTRCEVLIRERDSAVAECHHMRGILQSVETELGEKTQNFVQQYNVMKEQGASTVRDLQEKIEQLSQERDELLVRMTEITKEKNTLVDNMQDLQQKLEGSSTENEKLLSSVEEQIPLTCELKQSVEDLTKKNEELLSQLKMKENMIQDLEELVNTLTEGRDKMQNLLKLKEDEMQILNDEKTKDVEKLLEEKSREALLIREEKTRELENLKIKTEIEVKCLKEQNEKVEESLKEMLVIHEEKCSTLDLTIRELSIDKSTLLQKLEQALSELSKAQEDNELLVSKLTEQEAQVEQGSSEKQLLEAKLKSLTEEAEQASASVQTLKENHAEVLKMSRDEVEELQTRVDELEKERGLLKSSLEKAGAEKTEEVQQDLQAHIRDLEKERDMFRNNLEEAAKDVEGLQEDLQDMKSVNEKLVDENQKHLAHISLLKGEKELDEEVRRKMKNMERYSKELEDQLTEKDSLMSQLRSEIASLQVGGASDSCHKKIH